MIAPNYASRRKPRKFYCIHQEWESSDDLRQTAYAEITRLNIKRMTEPNKSKSSTKGLSYRQIFTTQSSHSELNNAIESAESNNLFNADLKGEYFAVDKQRSDRKSSY